MESRRNFLKKSIILTLGTAIAPSVLAKKRNNQLENLVYGTEFKNLVDNSKYPIEVNKLYGKYYLFGQHDALPNELDFSICYAEKTREIGNFGTGERIIEFKEEYIPKKVKDENGTKVTKLNYHGTKARTLTERKSTLISKNKYCQNSLTVSALIDNNGNLFELPAAKIKDQVYLVFQALKLDKSKDWVEDNQIGKIALYFLKYGNLTKDKNGKFTGEIDKDENAGWIIDNECGNIVFYQKDGIYRPILKNWSSKKGVSLSEESTTPAKDEDCSLYSVKKGDTLTEITKKFYDDYKEGMSAILKNNPQIKNPNKIFPGNKLKICK